MRFLVSGPVSSIFCLPTRPQRGSLGRVVLVGRPAVQHAARAEPLLELREVLRRVVGVLRLLLGVEVIEVAEELVEAVHGRQELVAVAEVVLAELAGGVAERLEQLGDGRVLAPAARPWRPGMPTLERPVRKTLCPVMNDGAAGGAALLAVGVGEAHPLVGDAVDVGRAIAHQPVAVAAQVADADVVAPDDEDVRLLVRLGQRNFPSFTPGGSVPRRRSCVPQWTGFIADRLRERSNSFTSGNEAPGIQILQF